MKKKHQSAPQVVKDVVKDSQGNALAEFVLQPNGKYHIFFTAKALEILLKKQ